MVSQGGYGVAGPNGQGLSVNHMPGVQGVGGVNTQVPQMGPQQGIMGQGIGHGQGMGQGMGQAGMGQGMVGGGVGHGNVQGSMIGGIPGMGMGDCEWATFIQLPLSFQPSLICVS